MLDASRDCGISDSGLQTAHAIRTLYASDNVNITTVAPFAKTLIVLDASALCGISDEGLQTAQLLVLLNCSNNVRISDAVALGCTTAAGCSATHILASPQVNLTLPP